MVKKMLFVVQLFQSIVGFLKQHPTEPPNGVTSDKAAGQLTTHPLTLSTEIKTYRRKSRAERIEQYLEEAKVRQRHNKEERLAVTPPSGPPTRSYIPPRSELTMDNLLPIDGFVPRGFEPSQVKAVIYWGFLRPARKVPLLNGNYAPREGIIRSIIGKGYAFEEVSRTINMLEHQGLVLSHLRVGGRDYSLNTKPNGTMSPPAKKIARICSAARYRLKRMTLGLE